jgi:hypothetical protein
MIETIVFFGVVMLCIAGYKYSKEKEEKAGKEKLKLKKKIEQYASVKEKETRRLSQIDNLEEQVKLLELLEVYDVSNFKKLLLDNESKISKLDNKKLYEFLKISSFLDDFKARILFEKSGIISLLDVQYYRKRVSVESIEEKKKISSGKINSAEELSRKMNETMAQIEGGATGKGFDWNFRQINSLGSQMNETMVRQNKTLEYYENIAIVMVLFFINDKKIQFFEIYESFEKMGVFDSTWNKNVLNKLKKIEIGISSLSNELSKLNDNFYKVLESTKTINENLKAIQIDAKNIKSSIDTSNLIQTITAYQVYQIKKRI